MDITKNKTLKGYNTFGIDCSSSFFARISSLNDLDELYRHPLFKSQKKLILGGGSNILFTSNYNGLVIKNEINTNTTLNKGNPSLAKS